MLSTADENATSIDEPVRHVRIGSLTLMLLPRKTYEISYTPDTSIIGFAYERQSGVHSFASDRRVDFYTKPNSLAYVPAGCDVYSNSNAGGEYLTLRFDEEFVNAGYCQKRFNDVVNHLAVQAAHDIRRMMMNEMYSDSLAIENAALVLQESVFNLLNNHQQQDRFSRYMTGFRTRFVCSYIEEHLDRKLTIQELAAALGVSTGFFSRSFKACFGKAPHDYILERRLYKARALLKSSSDLATIAFASGFSSHAHMSHAFHKKLGISPNQLRHRIKMNVG